MDDVPGFDIFVLRLQPGVDPKSFDAHDLLLFIAHGTGDVHHINDHCAGFRFDFGFPATVSTVFTKRDNFGIIKIVGVTDQMTLEGLLIGALKVTQ